MVDRIFWDRVAVDRVGLCWPWTGSKDSRGYGHLKWVGKISRAHRVAYMLYYGDIPKGEGHHGTCVIHACDNKLCCNPHHLRLGTHVDNMADMRDKGRRKGIGQGETNGRAVLTAEQVKEKISALADSAKNDAHKLKALELMGKVHAILTERTENVNYDGDKLEDMRKQALEEAEQALIVARETVEPVGEGRSELPIAAGKDDQLT